AAPSTARCTCTPGAWRSPNCRASEMALLVPDSVVPWSAQPPPVARATSKRGRHEASEMTQTAIDPALAELRDRVRAAAAAQRALCIRGGGTKDFYGQAPVGDPLDMRGYRGIVSYEPTELVITARCGTPLAEVEAALAERGQMLAFEPPAFGNAATIGGVVAAGLSGPRRANAGAVRDYVLGATLLDGAGRVLAFGGQVMKNVAGYDVSRLACGSLGILGPIVEVSLKVLPIPMSGCTVGLALDEGEALRALNAWSGQP